VVQEAKKDDAGTPSAPRKIEIKPRPSMSVLELRESTEQGLKSKSAALMAFDFHIDPFFLEPQRNPDSSTQAATKQ
jgi:hypothetical protein